jgi:xylulokinase
MEYLLGIDIGSGGVKETLLSVSGQPVASATVEYPTYYPEVSWTEQDPEDWYRAVCEGLSSLLGKSGVRSSDIRAIAVDAATHTAVLMDRDCRVLDRAILWTDQRSVRESAWLDERYGDMLFEVTYHRPDTLWTLPQLLWIRNHKPDVFERIGHILFAKDYIRWRLTGRICTDTIDAAGSMLYDVANDRWSPELCALAGLDPSVLPEALPPFAEAGKVTREAARETGLAEGTLVAAGATDTVMEVFGTGAVREGQSTVKLATAGRICAITRQPHPHPMFVTYRHVVPGLWYPGSATKSCAASMRWYRDVFGELEKLEEARGGPDAYEAISAAAATIAPGCDGLFFHPYLLGELTPYRNPHLRASFTGISAGHTKAHFSRAVMEGVAFSLRDCLSVFTEQGIRVENARLIGGASKSPVWRQITADVLGMELQLPRANDSSFGSAMLAGVCAGVFAGPEEAVERCVRIDRIIEPDPRTHALYEERFAVYRQIVQAMEPVYTRRDFGQ